MRKKVFTGVLKVIVNALSVFVPWKLLQLVGRFRNTFFSAIVGRTFRKCGKNFYIEYPAELKGQEYITIGDGFFAQARFRLEAIQMYNGKVLQPNIVIGNNVVINFDCHICSINEIIIGDDVLIASKVFITDHFHGTIDSSSLDTPPARRDLYSKGKVCIGDGVWIGENVSIMPNVKIGKNSIIGACSVVTRDVPENSVVVGTPARVIKTLR